MRKRIRKTRFQQLHLIITIVAALITTGICALTSVGLYNMAVFVSAVIIVFYVLGQVIRLYLEHVLIRNALPDEEILEGEAISLDDTDSNAYAEFEEANR